MTPPEEIFIVQSYNSFHPIDFLDVFVESDTNQIMWPHR